MKKSGDDNGRTNKEKLAFAIGGAAIGMAGFAAAANDYHASHGDNQQTEQEPEPREEASHQTLNEVEADAEVSIVSVEADNAEDEAVAEIEIVEDINSANFQIVSIDADIYPDIAIDEADVVSPDEAMIGEELIVSNMLGTDDVLVDSEILIADQNIDNSIADPNSDSLSGTSVGDLEAVNFIV